MVLLGPGSVSKLQGSVRRVSSSLGGGSRLCLEQQCMETKAKGSREEDHTRHGTG